MTKGSIQGPFFFKIFIGNFCIFVDKTTLHHYAMTKSIYVSEYVNYIIHYLISDIQYRSGFFENLMIVHPAKLFSPTIDIMIYTLFQIFLMQIRNVREEKLLRKMIEN